MRATKGYVAGVGTTSALVGAIGCAFAVMSAVVAVHGWPLRLSSPSMTTVDGRTPSDADAFPRLLDLFGGGLGVAHGHAAPQRAPAARLRVRRVSTVAGPFASAFGSHAGVVAPTRRAADPVPVPRPGASAASPAPRAASETIAPTPPSSGETYGGSGGSTTPTGPGTADTTTLGGAVTQVTSGAGTTVAQTGQQLSGVVQGTTSQLGGVVAQVSPAVGQVVTQTGQVVGGVVGGTTGAAGQVVAGAGATVGGVLGRLTSRLSAGGRTR
ncbi:MAG TPA: hypothetical protein VFG31_10940 [Conexibacter sp.]|nr:hypothetical protein [Conexibacter sp.]